MDVFTITYPVLVHSDVSEIVKKVGEIDIYVESNSFEFRARQRAAELLVDTRKEEENVKKLTHMLNDTGRKLEFETIEILETFKDKKKNKGKRSCKVVRRARDAIGAVQRLGHRIGTFLTIFCKNKNGGFEARHKVNVSKHMYTQSKDIR